MAVGPSGSTTYGVRAYQDLSRYFAWDLGEGAPAGFVKQASAKVRRTTIGVSLGKFGLDLTTQDVILDLPAPGSFADELSAAGLRDRATPRPTPAPAREPSARDARRGLAAYARSVAEPDPTAASRILGTV